MQQANPVEWFKSEITKRPVTAVVFYRGLWCPWCSGTVFFCIDDRNNTCSRLHERTQQKLCQKDPRGGR
jgi:hypothetical protein